MNEEEVQHAARLLDSGKIGVIPTDTVYGVVCRAADAAAAKRLYGLKDRSHKPGTIIAADIDQLVQLGLKRRYLTAVEWFWPGSVSVVIPTGPSLDHLHLGKFSLAVRIPKDKILNKLTKLTGPLLTTSANLPGKETAGTIDEAKGCFGGKVDFYVDGGDLSGHQASTVIRMVDDAVEILRQGSVKIDEETGKIHDI